MHLEELRTTRNTISIYRVFFGSHVTLRETVMLWDVTCRDAESQTYTRSIFHHHFSRRRQTQLATSMQSPTHTRSPLSENNLALWLSHRHRVQWRRLMEAMILMWSVLYMTGRRNWRPACSLRVKRASLDSHCSRRSSSRFLVPEQVVHL